jgi:putative aldouronate transport system substrate-binding protein
MKRNKLQRLVSLALCLLLTAAFSACGTSDTTSSSSGTSSVSSTSSNESTASTGETNSEEAPLEISAVLTMYETPVDTESDFWTDMESRCNVDYNPEWVPVTSYNDRLSLLVSTNDLPDIIRVENLSTPWTVKAMEAGMFYDFTDSIENYSNLAALSSSAWTNSKYKGRNYLIPNSRGQYNNCYFLRQDLLDKYGLPLPSTVDELTDYLEAIAQEDGMVPIPSNVDSPIELVQAAFGPGNIIPVYTEDNTGIVPFRLTESYALAVEWLQQLYSKGLVSKEFALLNSDQTEDLMLSGKGGIYSKNAWHSWRINEEVKKVNPDASFEPIFGLEGPGGTSVFYDMGYSGGLCINSAVGEEKAQRILSFMDYTCAPENYNYFYYGLEDVYWTMVDGYPSLTEEGQKVVNNSFYIPFTLATATYTKVDSPLATAEYNRMMEEKVGKVDELATKIDGAPFLIFNIINSQTFADWWAVNQTEFEAFRADVITGAKTIDQFREYQQQLMATEEIQTAMVEYKESYDEFGFDTWEPTT